MIGQPVSGTAVALALVIGTMGVVSAGAAAVYGFEWSDLIAVLFQITLPGLVALGAGVFWRLMTKATRPSWPFIFTAAGFLNVMIWAILTLFLDFEDVPEGGAVQVDITSYFPFIALGASLIWAICGGIFALLHRAGAGKKAAQ